MFDAKTAPNDELAEALAICAHLIRYWLTWNKRKRDLEDLSTDEDTVLITVPPHWPTRAALRQWMETLDEAALRLKANDRCESPSTSALPGANSPR